MENKDTITFEPSSLETIDAAIFKHIDEIINIHTTTNKGWKKVPVIWLGTERPYQIKNDIKLRDKVGKLKLPLITVTRASVAREDTFKGSHQALFGEKNDAKGGTMSITRRIKQDKTRNFANADRQRGSKGDPTGKTNNTKIVYETITMPIPVYVTCMFEINIRTEYQQQMNDIIPSFVFDTKNVFIVEQDGHKYEVLLQDDYGINNNLNSLGQEERMFTAKVQLKVLGYLIGDGDNRDRPQITKRENQVEVKISKERVIVGEKRPWAKDDGKYREF